MEGFGVDTEALGVTAWLWPHLLPLPALQKLETRIKRLETDELSALDLETLGSPALPSVPSVGKMMKPTL